MAECPLGISSPLWYSVGMAIQGNENKQTTYTIRPSVYNGECNGWSCSCGWGGIGNGWLEAEVNAMRHRDGHAAHGEKATVRFER